MPPIDKTAASKGITPTNAMPKTLPSGLSRFDNSPFVFIHADHASELLVSLVVPIPFATDAIYDSAKHNQDKSRHTHYLTIDSYAIVLEKMKQHPNFQPMDGEHTLYMLIPIEECIDDVHRISLMFQVEKDNWLGRYYYHLPTAIPTQDLGNPTDEELTTFKQELSTGVETLMQIIDQELSGEIPKQGTRATVGSLYIVGSSIGGLADPTIFRVKDSEILREDENSVVVRIPGDPKAAANAGGMAYGIHYFYKDQLHTFEKNSQQTNSQ